MQDHWKYYLFDEIFNKTDLSIFLLNKQLKIIDVNQSTVNLFKLPKTEFLGCNFNALFAKQQLDSPLKKINVFKGQLRSSIIKTQGLSQEEILIWNLLPLKNKQTSGPHLLLITRASHNNQVDYYLQYIIDHLPHSILWKDSSLRFLGCNLKVAQSAGLHSPKEIIGKTDYDLPWDKQQSDLYQQDDLLVMQTKKPKLNYEEIQTQSDGTNKVLLVSKVPMLNEDNEAIGILCVYTDITDRKKTEQELLLAKEKAELSNQAKSQFLAIMSHELRTPLNIILLAIQSLKETALTPDQQEMIETIFQSSQNQLGLIEDILDFAKLEAGKLNFHYTVFNLSQLANSVIKGLYHLVEQKPIKLFCELDSAIPTHVKGEAKRIRQILVNLLSNAIKFTQEGHIKLAIECLEQTAENIRLKFTVSDTGIGIPKDKLEYVFERFAQIESKYSRKHDGVGLGLAICRQIIEKMDGKICVHSEFGKGSQFFFELTLGIPDPRELVVHKTQEEHLTYTLTHTQEFPILVVEDNKIVQLVMGKLLEKLGCQNVTFIDNGRQAIESIFTNTYGLVFMDIGLPEVSGIDVIQAIREQEGANRHTPIIALTAHAAEEDQRNCFAAGADSVLLKPITKEQLVKTIDEWVNKWLLTSKQRLLSPKCTND